MLGLWDCGMLGWEVRGKVATRERGQPKHSRSWRIFKRPVNFLTYVRGGNGSTCRPYTYYMLQVLRQRDNVVRYKSCCVIAKHVFASLSAKNCSNCLLYILLTYIGWGSVKIKSSVHKVQITALENDLSLYSKSLLYYTVTMSISLGLITVRNDGFDPETIAWIF